MPIKPAGKNRRSTFPIHNQWLISVGSKFFAFNKIFGEAKTETQHWTSRHGPKAFDIM